MIWLQRHSRCKYHFQELHAFCLNFVLLTKPRCSVSVARTLFKFFSFCEKGTLASHIYMHSKMDRKPHHWLLNTAFFSIHSILLNSFHEMDLMYVRDRRRERERERWKIPTATIFIHLVSYLIDGFSTSRLLLCYFFSLTCMHSDEGKWVLKSAQQKIMKIGLCGLCNTSGDKFSYKMGFFLFHMHTYFENVCALTFYIYFFLPTYSSSNPYFTFSVMFNNF